MWGETDWWKGIQSKNGANALIGLGTGLLQGNTFAKGLAAGGQGFMQGAQLDQQYADEASEEEKRIAQINQTAAFLREKGAEDLAAAVEGGMTTGADAFNQWYQQANGTAGGQENFFGTGVPIKNADGTISYGQFGNQGGFNIPELPEGSEFLTPVQQYNIGTGFAGVDRFGNQTGQVMPIDNFTPAQDASLGKVIGDAAANKILELPQTIATTDNMITSIDGILNDPALDTSTGWLSWMQAVPGTEQYAFGQRALQLQGQAFLQAFTSLKGGGTITEIEGLKAEQAIGRLSTAQNPADYRQALSELKGIISAAKTRAVNSAGTVQLPPGAAIGGANQPSGRVLVYNPATGRLE